MLREGTGGGFAVEVFGGLEVLDLKGEVTRITST